MKYEVQFVLKFFDSNNMAIPTTFSLTTPDGCTEEHPEILQVFPRNQILCITAGEFQTPENNCGSGVIKFSMRNSDGSSGNWKHGMAVIGAVIVPKFIIKTG